MNDEDEKTAKETLAALLSPLARLMIETGITLPDAAELLKSALIDAAFAKDPDATASHVSLMTGVHRKDIKRLEQSNTAPVRTAAAARVLSLWQTDPDFLTESHPRVLERGGAHGFDSLVKRAKVDAAPATVLSILKDSGSAEEDKGFIKFVTASVVPVDRTEKLRTAVATLKPHLETTIGNVLDDRSQWDQALRYSHLNEDAARELEAEAARLSIDMLKSLNQMARAFQQGEEGRTLFVAGTFTHIKEHNE